jgi:hypothetical protein
MSAFSSSESHSASAKTLFFGRFSVVFIVLSLCRTDTAPCSDLFTESAAEGAGRRQQRTRWRAGSVNRLRPLTEEKGRGYLAFFLTDGRFVKPGFWYHIAGWAYEEPSGEFWILSGS